MVQVGNELFDEGKNLIRENYGCTICKLYMRVTFLEEYDSKTDDMNIIEEMICYQKHVTF